MTALVGMGAMAGGRVSATVATVAWGLSARGRPTSSARRATWAALGFALVAVGALQWALVTHDFSVRYVAENGGRTVPLYYTVTSMWGALEGSLLLWLLVLTAVGVVAMRVAPADVQALHPVAMAVAMGVATFFFGLALGGGNAFHTVSPVPADGPGPNPLLQDHPAMGIHPPLLYGGYVALTIPFAYSVAALVTGRVDTGWVRAVRGWTLAAWALLTAGILLGAWWSYAVLGWGGYWAWDPVENASLLPWLTATALLHSTVVQQRRRSLRTWNVFLAAASFFLVLVGTFLTRSSVVDSVHAFTESPLGPMLLGFLGVTVLGWIALLVLRSDELMRGDEGIGGSPLSRQTSVLANNLLLTVVAFTVLLGTVFPLLHETFTGDRVSVGPPYFSRMVAPAAFLVLALMAVAPLTAWDRQSPAALWRRSAVPAAVAAAGVGVLGIAGVGSVSVLAAAGAALFVLTNLVGDTVARMTSGRMRPAAVALGRTRRHLGVLLAHAGVVLAAVAVTVSSSYSESVQQTVPVGEQLTVAGTTATLRGVDRSADAQEMSATARVTVPSGRGVEVLRPELTLFRARSMVVASPAIDTSWTHDVYVTLVEVDPDAGTATLRLAVNPLVGLLWASGAVLLAGAGLAAWPARRRRTTAGTGQVTPGSTVTASSADVPTLPTGGGVR